MPGDSEHPVTVLGDLRVPCEHGLDRWHSHHDMSMCDGNHDDPCAAISNCPGGGPATVADLVSALRAEGVLVVEKGEGRNKWPEWVYFNWPTDYPRMGFITATLDGLAEAQPFPPAGG